MQAASSFEDSCLNRKSQDASRWSGHTAVLPIRDLILSAIFLSLMVNFLCFSCFLKNLFKKTWKIAVEWCKVFTAVRCVITLCFVLLSLTLDLTVKLFWLDLEVSSPLCLFYGPTTGKQQRGYRDSYLLRILVHTLKKDCGEWWPECCILC